MKCLATIIFLGFIGMAVFGFVGMAQSPEHNGVSCLAIAANGGICPTLDGWLAFSVFHLAALKKFSTAVFSTLVLFFAFVLFAAMTSNLVLPIFVFNLSTSIFEKSPSQRAVQLIHWLSLHENSPSVI